MLNSNDPFMMGRASLPPVLTSRGDVPIPTAVIAKEVGYGFGTIALEGESNACDARNEALLDEPSIKRTVSFGEVSIRTFPCNHLRGEWIPPSRHSDRVHKHQQYKENIDNGMKMGCSPEINARSEALMLADDCSALEK